MELLKKIGITLKDASWGLLITGAIVFILGSYVAVFTNKDLILGCIMIIVGVVTVFGGAYFLNRNSKTKNTNSYRF